MDSSPKAISPEAKASFKSTELFAYLLAFAGILIASKTISVEDGRPDWFRADQAWLYITVLTTVYMVSRGLAKSGSGPVTTTVDLDGEEGDGAGDARPLESTRPGTARVQQAPSPPLPHREVSGVPSDFRADVPRSGRVEAEPRALQLPSEKGEGEQPERHHQETGEAGLANVALALAGAGLVSIVFTFGALFFLALPLGLVAMVLSRLASRRSERLAGAPGSGRARLAWILGLIATVLSALVLALVVLGVTVVERFI